MIYRLKPQQGDTVAVPQLVFARLGAAEEASVRVALYVLATGVTDPDKLCADLKLRSRITAESALAYWAGAGLLERWDENAAPGGGEPAPTPMRWTEIAAASRTDPMIASLIDCAQTTFARALTHGEMEKLVALYLQEGFEPETVMLCLAYLAGKGKRTRGALSHELNVWRAEGVETGEEADAHLKLLALREKREAYVASLLETEPAALTLGGKKAIARWYEVYGYDDAMIQEAAVQAGPKRDLWYWNSILKTWNAKGLRTVRDVRGPAPLAGGGLPFPAVQSGRAGGQPAVGGPLRAGGMAVLAESASGRRALGGLGDAGAVPGPCQRHPAEDPGDAQRRLQRPLPAGEQSRPAGHLGPAGHQRGPDRGPASEGPARRMVRAAGRRRPRRPPERGGVGLPLQPPVGRRAV